MNNCKDRNESLGKGTSKHNCHVLWKFLTNIVEGRGVSYHLNSKSQKQFLLQMINDNSETVDWYIVFQQAC